jgi:hypothetical protein
VREYGARRVRFLSGPRPREARLDRVVVPNVAVLRRGQGCIHAGYRDAVSAAAGTAGGNFLAIAFTELRSSFMYFLGSE